MIRVELPDRGMKRRLVTCYFVAVLLTACNQGHVIHNWAALCVVHFPSSLVTHPTVDSSSSGIHPQQMFEPEIFSQHSVNDLSSDAHEFPTSVANVSPRTTSSDVVVVSHINIKDKFLVKCSKSRALDGAVHFRRDREDSSDVNFLGIDFTDLIFEVFDCREALIADIDIVMEWEWELATREVSVRGHWVGSRRRLEVAQPVEHSFKGIEALVVDLHLLFLEEPVHSAFIL